jgi:hypothetical protein
MAGKIDRHAIDGQMTNRKTAMKKQANPGSEKDQKRIPKSAPRYPGTHPPKDAGTHPVLLSHSRTLQAQSGAPPIPTPAGRVT